MTVTARCLVETGYAANAQTTVYTSPASSGATIIDKATVANMTAAAATFAVNLVPSGGAAGAGNVVYSASVGPGTTEELTVLEGHILAPGDFISVIAGTASAIVFRASGRLVSG